jgi:general secretion pathway protein A
MRESQLGMQSLPSRDLAFFFPSPTHEEALARLDFLVEQGYSLSILSGCEGAGKSTVVDVLAGKLRRSGRTAHVMNLLGADVRGFLWSLAAGLGANPPGDEDATLLWRRIDDRLEENALQGIGTVLFLDDADGASHDVLIQVLRLLKTQQDRLIIILAVESSRMARLGGDLLQLSQLRIHLDPWDQGDVREYLHSSLAKAEFKSVAFEETAVTRLHELSGGVPRSVSRLSELAVLAATSQGRGTVDAEIIDCIYQELSPTYRDPAPHAAF